MSAETVVLFGISVLVIFVGCPFVVSMPKDTQRKAGFFMLAIAVFFFLVGVAKLLEDLGYVGPTFKK